MDLPQKNGTQLSLVQGSIADEKSDVCVNTVGSNLDFNISAVSRALRAKGGSRLEDECKQKCPNGLEIGEVIDTSGGNLDCGRVYHCSPPTWREDKELCKKVLPALMKSCLVKAHSENMTSISFPAMSTGAAGVPRNIVANFMFDEVERFCNKYMQTSLKRINFVLHPGDHKSIKEFEDYLKIKKRTPCIHISEQVTPENASRIPRDRGFHSEYIPPSEVTFHSPDEPVGATMNFQQENGTQLSLVQGSIADEKSDVCVNTVGSNLDFNITAVSRALLAKAGSRLEDECKQKCPNGLEIGEVIDTSGGNLDCGRVYHCSPPTWREDKELCKKVLPALMKSCLVKAHNENMTSISFPAMSTGAAGVPRNIVANFMFEEVERFCNTYMQTSLKRINFVLHPGDHKSIKEFEDYLKIKTKAQVRSLLNPRIHISEQVTTPEPASRTRGDRGFHSEYIPPTEPVAELPFVANAAPSQYKGKIVDIGNINLQVKQGDLTEECTDAIVNTTNANFSAAGAVSEAVFRVGGIELQQECHSKKRIKADVELTKSGGLPCKHVIHVSAPQKEDEWCNRIKKALKLAEKHDMKSISFPALGTGAMRVSPADMASIMVTEICKHAAGHNRTLRTIYICIYESKMTSAFEAALQDAVLTKTGWLHKFGKIFGDSASGRLRRTSSGTLLDAGTTSVLRRSRSFCASEDEPLTWTSMSSGNNLEVVTLNSSSEEYREISKRMIADIKSCTIYQVHRIQNKKIHSLYKSLQRHMSDPEERRLWHGTSQEAVDSISSQGFDRQRHGKNGTLFGKGTYFATSAAYSKRYARENAQKLRRMYQCKVLTGEYTKGNKDMLTPPPKNPDDPKEKHVLYDSLVDDVNNPKIFVIFQDNQAYPEYLITFKAK